MKKRYYYSIASGSKGNCALYVYDDTYILIDMGVSVRSLKQSLLKVGVNIEDLTAILITHEHTDHIKGISTFAKKYNTPIYATKDTVREIIKKTPHASDILYTITADLPIAIGDVSVTAMLTPHDAVCSVGYIISNDMQSLGYVTDIGFMPNAIKSKLIGCDIVVIESNHDPYLLRNCDYPWSIKERIAGSHGHLSNADCATCVAQLVKTGTKTVVLAHLSEQSNTPLLAFSETKQALVAENIDCDLYVAPKDAMENIVELQVREKACCQ